MQNEKAMLDGNIARIMISKDVSEIERMREWAHKRIDIIADSKIEDICRAEKKVMNTSNTLHFCHIMRQKEDCR